MMMMITLTIRNSYDDDDYAEDEDKPDKGVPVDKEDNSGGNEASSVLGGQVVGHLGGGSNNPLGHFHLQLFPALNCSFVCLFWLRSSMCSLFCTEH